MDPRPTTMIEELRPLLMASYPDLSADAVIDVVEHDQRALVHLLHVKVTSAGGGTRSLIVKSNGPVGPSEDRPRLVSRVDPAERLPLEFKALRLVEARLATIGDPTLTAVRAIGILPRSDALVMETFEWTATPSRARPGTLAARSGDALRAPRGGGRTLAPGAPRERGRRPAGAPADPAGDRRSVPALGTYLAPRMRSHDVEGFVEAGIEAASTLPDQLPLVVSHGDFAPRNILVDRSGRIAVIDLLARWQAPPYEDLAGFLVALHTSRANAVTRGVVFGRALDRLEPAFLTGYYGSEAVPRSAIRVYELLLVLDRWASRSSREARMRRSRSLRERSIDAHFAARSRRLVVGLRQGT